MGRYNIIFCVLTYKNSNDLKEFIENLKGNNKINFSYKIIVINNYADETTSQLIKEIAYKNDCVFIESENKGYSYGNNLGIKYAKENFEFDYLIVCNPDTYIIEFDFNNIVGNEDNIVAPEIIRRNGKKQNPMYYKYMPVSEKVVYIGLKRRSKAILYFGIFLNKFSKYIYKMIFTVLNKKQHRIYACHGSYIIFGKNALERLYPIFDENIFLFCEENDLAKKAKKIGVEIIFNKNIVIYHKEDGSMKLSNKDLYEILRDSYLYYYEKWHRS